MRTRHICIAAMIFAMFCRTNIHAAERILRNEIVIQSTVEKAWQALTTEEGVKARMTKSAEIEMKLSGKYHTNYNGKVGDPGTITNTILSYIPNRMFSFRLGYPENFTVPDENGKAVQVPDVVKAGTVFAVVEFEDIGNGRIRARVTMPGYQEGREWDLVYNFFNRGNDYDLQRLKKYLESR